MSELIQIPPVTPEAPPAPAAAPAAVVSVAAAPAAAAPVAAAPAAAPVVPAATPQSPQVPEVAESDSGSEETGLFAGGASPALNLTDPAQQAPAPAEGPLAPVAAPVAVPVAPGTPPVQAPVPPVEGVVQQQIPAKDDPTRFEYHQSRADRAINSDEMRIGEFIKTQPDLYQVATERLNGGRAAIQAAPERPTRPVKPSNYDVSDMNDPDTVSGNYTADYQVFLEKKDDYDVALADYNTNQSQQAAQQNQLVELGAGLVREGGLSDVEAQEAIALFTSGRARDPKLLADLYRISKKPDQTVQANQQRALELISSQPGLVAPAPVAVASGQSPAGELDPQALWSADMAARAAVPKI